ncbi:MAG TPA: calcium-binding protein, partial [Tepidisphaeraceae bacterium]
NYASIENLNISTGSGSDVFNVQGTSAVTNLNTNDGNDRIYVADTANVQAAGPFPAALFGNLNAIAADLNINGGTGSQTLMVSDSTASVGDSNVTVTKSTITGLATGNISYAASGNFFGGITIWAGQGADNVVVASTLNTAGGRTVTTLNTGGGNDSAAINLGSADGFFVANGQAGDDILNGSTSTRSLYLFGGVGSDTINGGSASDVIIADTGRAEFGVGAVIGGAGDVPAISTNIPADKTDGIESLATKIYTIDPTLGGNDSVTAGAGNDIVLGGNGGDTLAGGADNDLVFGDHASISGTIDQTKLPVSTSNMPFTLTSIDTSAALGGNDVISGDDGADILLGQQGVDVIRGGAGDDDIVGGHNVAGGSDAGDAIDGGTGNDAIAGDNASVVRNPTALSSRIRKLSGTTIYDANGNPLVTAAAQLDPRAALKRSFTLFDHSTTAAAGTSGNDSIAGGAGDDKVFGQLGNDFIQGDGVLATTPASAATDGDDYIEGNGGDDAIYGNGGQDDLIGGSSTLYGLTTVAQRLDGSDTIYGGSGTAVDRYNAGDTSAGGHAADADVILGDNGNIYRLIGNDGKFLRFNYDKYAAAGITVRGVASVDYTAGGAASDIGGNDLLQGEAGDDSVYGQLGNDVLFGQGQDDDLVGGSGHDRIYGGSGEDGVIGDDGLMLTSRNGLAEPLNGVTTAATETYYKENGPSTGFWGYITGRLQKTAKLLAHTKGGHDTVYGGTGDDFLHAGTGDDAVSGAEATAAFYNTLAAANFNVLGYNASTRKLAAYDANNPMTKIANFLLNFDAEINGVKVNDGKDRLFGDWGNDWLVGGTMNDRLFGGAGDDVMNADDNHDTAGGLNNQPDAPKFADADFVYGGDGLDVLIGNTGADRLYDWSGEFNSYLVPFSPFGDPTVNRLPAPSIVQFLLNLAKESGSDQTLAEPNGEAGLFTQKDPQWGRNNGSPRDPQPGNSKFARDTIGGPEDDRGTRLSLTSPTSVLT